MYVPSKKSKTFNNKTTNYRVAVSTLSYISRFNSNYFIIEIAEIYLVTFDKKYLNKIYKIILCE